MQNLEKKRRLRTASEVMSRLKWSGDDSIASLNETLVGYDCRIHGPLEKCAADFNTIDEGGDIPEHRIQYFRNKSFPIEEGIFWDRKARVDRLFGSGDGLDAPLSPQTIDDVAAAIVTMERLAEEKALRTQQKAKIRARQLAKKIAASKKLMGVPNDNHNPTSRGIKNEKNSRLDRHSWETVNHYHSFDKHSSKWTMQSFSEKNSSRLKEIGQFKIITWNILFDIMRDENNNFIPGDNSLLTDEDSTINRWGQLLDIIRSENASIILLQEVTPRFIEQLQSQEWVKDNYELTSALGDISCLDPFGNVIMWRKELFHPHQLYVCKDLNRCRALIVSLRLDNNAIFNIANAHLPADNHDHGTRQTNDRTMARKRELGAIIAKLQYLEQLQKDTESIPFIIGDFNSSNGLVPKDHFDDLWVLSAVDDPGLSYNWKINKRAQKLRSSGFSTKEPRRIDRIYVGRNCAKNCDQARLLGGNSSQQINFPPSDHFGVTATFQLKENTLLPLYDPKGVDSNTWSKNALPTNESILALISNDSMCDGVALYDKSSSLPLAHVTLLNGFVDLSSDEQQILATQAVHDAVRQAFHSHEQLELGLDPTSLQIFEHRNSATLVCCPNVEQKNVQWLTRLYNTLRAKFILCHEQESRFATGWTPHLSLGSFSNISEARSKLTSLQSEASWHHGAQSNINAYGIGLFRRDVNDGKFHIVNLVPFSNPQPVDSFLNDAGLSASNSMKGISSVVLKEIELACDYAAVSMAGNQIETSLHCYGSHAQSISLPNISDIDTIVKVKASSSSSDALIKSIDSNSYLKAVASRLHCLHKGLKMRIRVSNTHSGPLYVMTIKLGHRYPSLDLLICKFDSLQKPIGETSENTLRILQDSDMVLSSIKSFKRINALGDEMIQGALRIIKVWANQRYIYGTKSGFLGGGAWAILLIRLLRDCNQGELFTLFDEASSVIAAKKIASYFFRNILSLWLKENIITLSGREVTEIALNWNKMSVIAPISAEDFGRSTTQSTTFTTKAEILRAQQILQENSLFEDSVINTFHMYSGSLMTLEVGIPSEYNVVSLPRPAEIKAWGAMRNLSLTVALENVISPSIIRPISNIIRKKASFVFFVGIQETLETIIPLLGDFMKRQNIILKEEMKVFLPNSNISLSCSSPEDYIQ